MNISRKRDKSWLQGGFKKVAERGGGSLSPLRPLLFGKCRGKSGPRPFLESALSWVPRLLALALIGLGCQAIFAEPLPTLELKVAFPELTFNRPLWMEEA